MAYQLALKRTSITENKPGIVRRRLLDNVILFSFLKDVIDDVASVKKGICQPSLKTRCVIMLL